MLILAVSVLMIVAIGFIVAAGRFGRGDLLAIALYLGLAAFVWHPMTASFIVMTICGTGVIFTGSGGDLLELALALGLVAATCAPWVIVTHAMLLAALTTDVAVNGSTLTDGGVFGIAGIAAIAFLAGVAFRMVAAREGMFVAERARIVKNLEAIAHEERERIADELHDGIAHDLTLVLFHARALPRQPNDESRQVSLTTIEESAQQALQSIQSLLSLMRERTTDGSAAYTGRYDGNVVQAVTSLGALLEDAGIPTQVAVPEIHLTTSPATGRLLIEIAIEAVTNIIKHAPNAQSASIDIDEKAGVVELIVKNAAAVVTADQEGRLGGRGLTRSRERLAQVRGQLDAGRTSAEWVLRARVPSGAENTRRVL
ncbi:MAG: histidine kinase [Microbacterium sp.]